MTVGEFERVLRMFADDASGLDLSNGKVLVEVRDELVDASLEDSLGQVYVVEHGDRLPAAKWLTRRIARTQLLADRIITHVEDEPYYVSPSGRLLDRINDAPNGKEAEIRDDVDIAVLRSLDGKAGTTSIHYLTSESGEGKTTVINRMAHVQAERFKRKEANWLLLPIRLGGRSFLSFDDIVVAELASKLRFPFFYYDAFLELVRMRVIVPAFDGFEEMFVERSSGEAISALSTLIRDLRSSGSVLVAARKAYFEYQSLETQAKLFDATSDCSVDYARTSLNRWSRQQFLEYAEKRGLSDGKLVYEKVQARVGGSDHPLLTRAVLVKKLIEVWEEGGADDLLERLDGDPDDYLHSCVESIVVREAREKWINRSDSTHQPLLSVEEHHLLLAQIAREMWLTSTNVLPKEYMELVAELFAADQNKDPSIAREISQRVTHHSLLARQGIRYGFDHEDFRNFYLGEALGQMFVSSPDVRVDLANVLRKGVLASLTANSGANAAGRKGVDLDDFLATLQWLVERARPTSYIVENAGALALRLLELTANGGRTQQLSGFVFPQDGLKGRRFGSVDFRKCQFQSTSLDGAQIGGCRFIECTMNGLEWREGFVADGAVIHGGNGTGLVVSINGVCAPSKVRQALRGAKFRVKAADGQQDVPVEPDSDTILAESVLRVFLRATHVSDEVLRRKCGGRAPRFFGSVLPKMLKAGILAQVEGVRKQRRFKLQVSMRAIAAAVPARVKTLDEFLASLKAGL